MAPHVSTAGLPGETAGRQRRHRSLRLLAALLVLAHAPAPARAEGDDGVRVAVARFEGPRHARLRVQVMRRLAPHVEIVDRAIRVQRRTDVAYARAAKKLRVTWIVAGTVRPVRGGFELSLALRAADGQVAAELVLPVRANGQIPLNERGRIDDELLTAIGPRAEEAGEARADAAETESERGPAARDDAPARSARAEAPAAPARAPPAAGVTARVPAPDPAPRGARLGSAFRLTTGVVAIHRWLDFDVDRSIPNRPRPYRGWFLAGRVEGQLHPFALGFLGPLRDFGLSAEAAVAPPFDSEAAGIGRSLPTRYHRVGAGAHYRVRAGRALELEVGGGYGRKRFRLEPRVEAELPGLPASVKYSFVHGTGALRVRAGRRLVLSGRGSYLLVQGSGLIESDAFFGPATSHGFAGALGAALRFGRALVGADVRFTEVNLSFLGLGRQSDLDGDGVPDVAAARDRYLSAWLALGLEL